MTITTSSIVDPKLTSFSKQIEVTESGDDAGVVFTEQVSVGTWDNPKEMVVGSGDSTTQTMVALQTDDDVTYTDVTTIWQSDQGSSTGMFNGVTAGKTVYLGADFKFNGIKVKINTEGQVEPDRVVMEYWTGSAWFPVPYMATSSDEPLSAFGWKLAQNGVSSEQWYFNFDPTDIAPDWQQHAVDGITKYWGRFRIISDITADPIIEQVKLHTPRFEANACGCTQYFGESRYKKTVLSGVDILINNALQSPASQAVAYTPTISADYGDNQFNNNARDSKLFVLNVDEGLDTSIPIEVVISFYVEGTGTGDIEFTLGKIPVGDGFIYDGTSSVTTEYSVISQVITPSNLERRSIKMYMPINDGGPDIPAYLMEIARDATGTNPNDTVPHNVVVTHVIVNGWFWKP